MLQPAYRYRPENQATCKAAVGRSLGQHRLQRIRLTGLKNEQQMTVTQRNGSPTHGGILILARFTGGICKS